ncbi:hypothetical protein PTT_15993 [Pyrenophora teres f. teres 0-1]|uniref:Uncharacterized protein n=1 Tax=Pyrenophora teres f. teres (strain 0-1) TaxID=861557 RepID=E3S1C6_PYRTT|nr:hypothetical protein PTT_15993 [Pyrenophora teres f. teres 0-1]
MSIVSLETLLIVPGSSVTPSNTRGEIALAGDFGQELVFSRVAVFFWGIHAT